MASRPSARRSRAPRHPHPRIPRRGLRRVLVAHDFSPGAEAALARCLDLALGRGADLLLLHVLPSDLRGRAAALAERGAAAEMERVVTAAASTVSRRGRDDVTIRGLVAPGRSHEEICRQAAARRVDLVVIGRRGHSRGKAGDLGATASRVLRSTPTPILLVAGPPRSPYLRPVLAVDLSPSCRRAASILLRLLPEAVRDRVTAMHADETPFEQALLLGGATPRELTKYRREHAARTTLELQAVLDEFAPQSEGWKVIRKVGDARTHVLGAAASGRADLVALGTHGRSGLARALLGSVAERVTRGARVDVLVAPMRG